MRFLTFIFIILSFYGCTSYTIFPLIEGVVCDNYNRKPIQDVQIGYYTVKDSSFIEVARTDKYGCFKIDKVKTKKESIIPFAESQKFPQEIFTDTFYIKNQITKMTH